MTSQLVEPVLDVAVDQAGKRTYTDVLEMRLAVPAAVERRDVANSAVVAKRQAVTLGHGPKDRRDGFVAMHVVMRVDVRRAAVR